MSGASFNRVRSAVVSTVMISAWMLISAGVVSSSVAYADGGLAEGSLTEQDVSRMLADSLAISLAPVTAEDLDATDRSRAVAADLLVADDEPALWTTLVPVKPEEERPAMRPTLSRPSRSPGFTLVAGVGQGSADRTDPFPHSRVTMPLLVGGFLGGQSDSAATEARASFRPLTGAVVGVRPSYLRPRLPGER